MQFVIIGGDAAGMSAASRLKRRNPEISVTVIEKTEDVSYSACGMPYNIADATRSIDDLVVRRADVFRKQQGINLLTGHCGEQIDTEKRVVKGTCSDGRSFQFFYDQLLIATGASPILPPVEGVDLPGVMALKSLEQGRRIKDFLASDGVRRSVIIGMGYIALEMCEALRARGLAVAMVKPRETLLPWLPAELSQVVRKELEDNGVALHPGQAVQGIEAANGGLRVRCDAPDLEADLVLVAMGVRPNSGLAAAAGLTLGPHDAIAVDRQLKTSDDHIYAAGDCADAFHVVTGERTWVPLALRANRAGWAVADAIGGRPVELPGVAGTAVFKVFELEVARTGLNSEEAAGAGFEPVAVVIQARSRAHAHPGANTIWIEMTADKRTGRLLGAAMVGREGVAHRINAAAVGLHAGMTVAQFAQTDLAYAPPFGPVWDPLLTAANQLLKKL
jgi:NADPH-dependent 2,4-dienoyl-CoA reductase/sulfur reductase-like enzyme